MPHLVLEYSNNIVEKANLQELFQQCHQQLVEILPTELTSCKSRAIEYQTYLLANGDTAQAFVHLDLKILPGRDKSTLDKASHAIMDLLKGYFTESAQRFQLHLSLEIQELAPSYYKMTLSG